MALKVAARSVFPDWLLQLPLQQQSVLILACRGPDGINKFHPTKRILRAYRASILKQARTGRMTRVGEEGDSFMSLDDFHSDAYWENNCQVFFAQSDDLPHHYYMHLMHGTEVLAYKHPDAIFRYRWLSFYTDCCNDLHLFPENEKQMDMRLNDWGQLEWVNETKDAY